MKIVDDDIDWRQLALNEEENKDEDEDDEAPVVCRSTLYVTYLKLFLNTFIANINTIVVRSLVITIGKVLWY